MTYDELKKTGKNGVYRADLDEWFIEGEEPPLPSKQDEPEQPAKSAPAPEEPIIEENPAATPAPVKTTKGSKHD
jgi:hypothetical protein